MLYVIACGFIGENVFRIRGINLLLLFICNQSIFTCFQWKSELLRSVKNENAVLF